MAEFEYESEDGKTVTRRYRAGKAPRTVRVDGEVYRRSYRPGAVPAFGGIRSSGAVGNGLHVKAWSQPTVPPGEDPRAHGFERVDPEDGVGLIHGEREMRNYMRVQNKLAEAGKADPIQWLGDRKD